MMGKVPIVGLLISCFFLLVCSCQENNKNDPRQNITAIFQCPQKLFAVCIFLVLPGPPKRQGSVGMPPRLFPPKKTVPATTLLLLKRSRWYARRCTIGTRISYAFDFQVYNSLATRAPTYRTCSRQVFFRSGVVAINGDSPVQHMICNCKQSGGSTWMPCNICTVTRDDLGNGQFDFAKNMRTLDGIDYSLSRIREEPNLTRKAKISKETGVVGADTRNPIRENIFVNVIKSAAVDIFHQDAMVR